jgi:CheY-like chemotaxis protein
MKLKQVLINILGNSVKFTDVPGRVTLSVEAAEETGENCRLIFRMRDTGIGMDPEFIPKLFEAFSQENAGATNRYGGSGLGMAITRNLVDMMNGTIQVESQKGVGSLFTVTVLLGKSDRVLPAVPQKAQTEAESCLAGCRVLMAEDVEQNAEILQDLLELEGIEAEWAENGEAAVRMFSDKPAGYYDAVLMDVRMPVMDGLTAAETIRKLDRPDAAAVPIIAMTANVFDEDVERSLKAGMNAHLTKPIEPERLYRTLADMIRKGDHDA